MVAIVDDLKMAIGVFRHPYQNTKKSMTLGGAFGWYYKFSLIPLILSVIITLVGRSGAIGAITAVVEFWILIPIGLLIIAVLEQLVGGTIFKWFKGNFEATLTAAVYGIVPVILLGWLAGLFSVIGGGIAVVAFIGVIIAVFAVLIMMPLVGVIALGNQQKVGTEAYVTVAVVCVIIAIITFAIFFAIAASLGGLSSLGTLGGLGALGGTPTGYP